jgi:hypothetical protein
MISSTGIGGDSFRTPVLVSSWKEAWTKPGKTTNQRQEQTTDKILGVMSSSNKPRILGATSKLDFIRNPQVVPDQKENWEKASRDRSKRSEGLPFFLSVDLHSGLCFNDRQDPDCGISTRLDSIVLTSSIGTCEF